MVWFPKARGRVRPIAFVVLANVVAALTHHKQVPVVLGVEPALQSIENGVYAAPIARLVKSLNLGVVKTPLWP